MRLLTKKLGSISGDQCQCTTRYTNIRLISYCQQNLTFDIVIDWITLHMILGQKICFQSYNKNQKLLFCTYTFLDKV